MQKYKRDIMLLLLLTFVVAPAFVAFVTYAAALTYSPGVVSWSGVEINTTSSNRTVTITNTSPSDVSGSVSLSGPDDGSFTIEGGGAYNNLAPNDTHIASFSFSPTAVRSYTASADFSSNSGTNVACSADELQTCSDGIQNQDETGIDCGGVCGACAVPDCPNDTVSWVEINPPYPSYFCGASVPPASEGYSFVVSDEESGFCEGRDGGYFEGETIGDATASCVAGSWVVSDSYCDCSP